eukprot:maker-scaffold_67-snap-gene-0.3-mRNA-1 protein AED:0.01 eAED:0.01 QI:113/1/1/1/0.66/0.5/4/21/579
MFQNVKRRNKIQRLEKKIIRLPKRPNNTFFIFVSVLTILITILWIFLASFYIETPFPTPPKNPPKQLISKSADFYLKKRQDEIKNRLNFIKTKQDSGKNLAPQEMFDLHFLSFSITKSKVSGPFSSDHCVFSGPRGPANWNKEEENKLKKKLYDKSYLSHLDKEGIKLISTEHEMCTSRHPVFFNIGNPSLRTGKFQESSAYVFYDVCVVFNLDSVKKSQRGIIIFDNTNLDEERCIPCPNPQMNKKWSLNSCGIMWLHQINSLSKISDYQSCYHNNIKKILAHGQRQNPGEENEVLAAVYYEKTTLLLQFVHMNPGHQLWDLLLSLVDILRSELSFPFAAVHQIPNCPEQIWICVLLRKLGLISDKNLIPMHKNTLTCFKELVAPIPGWNHDNSKLPPSDLIYLRDRLITAFSFNLLSEQPKSKVKMLLYPHSTSGEAGFRRAWLNVAYAQKQLEKKFDVTLITDFASVAVVKQAKLFFESDILVMSHGGQMGNCIFCRSGTIVVEVTCGGYSQMRGPFSEGLGLKHVVYKPCKCDERKDEGNYELEKEEVEWVIKQVRNIGSIQIDGKKMWNECIKS